jgi:hypothetical protein
MVKLHGGVGYEHLPWLAYLWRRVMVEKDGFWPSTFDRGTVESAFEIWKLGGSSTVFLQSDDVFRGVVHV